MLLKSKMPLSTILFNKPISFVITDDNLFATRGVLTDSNRSKCLYVLKNINEIMLVSKLIKLKESKIIHKDVDFASLKKYNFITYNLFKEYLIEKKEQYNLFDQIFIPINETKNVDLFLIIKMINKIRKDKINICNVCYILRNNSIEASYELKLKKDNTFIHNNSLEVTINYSPTDLRKGDKNINFTIIDHIQSTKIEANKNILVILNTGKDVQHMYYHMLKKLDTRKYFVSSIYASNPDKLNFIDRKDDKKIMVYLLSSDLTTRIPLPDIGYIFDSFVYSSSSGQAYYNSKDRANKYVNYFSPTQYIDLLDFEDEEAEKFHITRYVSCEFFEKSYAYDVPCLGPNMFYYNFLLLIDNSYDPIDIFKNFIDMGAIGNIFTTLNNMKIINNDKVITVNYKMLFSFGLYLRPSLLIMKAIENKEPLYPFIVLASIITHSENGFYIPMLHNRSAKSGMLKEYLDVFIKYSKELKSINPDRDALYDWCDAEQVNKIKITNILNSIKNICHVISYEHKITLGLFDTNNLIQKAIPYLLEIYVGFVYKQVDKHVHHYSNEISIVKIDNSESDYPENVISFKSVKPAYKNRKTSGSMDTITFYLGFNIS